jgi:lipid-binding SYLF domain-containing protein
MKGIRLPIIAICAVIFAQLGTTPAWAADTPDRLKDAADALNALSAAKDDGIPEDLLKKAACIIVVPSLKKAALGIGAEYGRGFASCRSKAGWSAPASVKVEGGSFGFQIGGSETEVVMLVMNKKGMDRLLGNKFTLGADASIAAGPVGRAGAAKTDAAMTAEILSYSRSRGVFAGVALSGATLREDESANEDLYGKQMSNRMILGGSVEVPASARPFLAAIRNF